MSVTLDTNVYVSALNFGGRAARLLAMAEKGAIAIDISDHIENELICGSPHGTPTQGETVTS